MWPSGSTKLAGVMGYPVRHSRSPAMHNAAYRALGIDAVYVAMPVLTENVEVAVRSISALDMLGVSVTTPLKSAVISFLDELTFGASRLGAVNCIANSDGRLIGHNTDGAGFVASLIDSGFDPADKRVVLFGAGGSARAVAAALADAGVSDLAIVNRTQTSANEAAALAGDAVRVGDRSDVRKADIVVNATPMGMEGSFDDLLPLEPELLRPDHVVADLVYHPVDTPLLVAARKAGAKTVDGTGMLLHQAAEQIRLWTRKEPPLDVMRQARDQFQALDEQ